MRVLKKVNWVTASFLVLTPLIAGPGGTVAVDALVLPRAAGKH